MQRLKIGYAICGSFCTINNSVEQLKKLISAGHELTVIPSPIVQTTNTRFTNASQLSDELKLLTNRDLITNIETAEPIGPKKMFDVMIVCPCTSNTIAKLANGIVDNNVTMAVKSHIRNNRPVVLATATNDALGASARNIGTLLNTRNIYFVPFKQDDPINKERSMIADFEMVEKTIENAILGKQLQPIVL
jgi:dipicolinate synthase subunit B